MPTLATGAVFFILWVSFSCQTKSRPESGESKDPASPGGQGGDEFFLTAQELNLLENPPKLNQETVRAWIFEDFFKDKAVRTDPPSSADDELPGCLRGYDSEFNSKWKIDAGKGYMKLSSNWALENCKDSGRNMDTAWEHVYNMKSRGMISIVCEGSDFSKMTVSDFFSETAEKDELCHNSKNASFIYAMKSEIKLDIKITIDGKITEVRLDNTDISANYADAGQSFAPCEYMVNQGTSTLKSPCKEISIHIEQGSGIPQDPQENPRMISKYDLDSKLTKVHEAGTIFSGDSTSGKVLFAYNDWQGELSYANSEKPQKCTMRNATSSAVDCLPVSSYSLTTASGSAWSEKQKIMKRIEMSSPMRFLPKRSNFFGK